MTSISRAAVFLDRDGTLNVEKNYLYCFDDWEWIPGVVEVIRRINTVGHLAIVVTNQAGIARGHYGEDDLQCLHRQIGRTLANEGACIDAYYCCPHHPEYEDARECDCRKSKNSMLLQAQREFNIDLAASWLIGDKLSDIETGIYSGVTLIPVRTGYGAEESLNLMPGVRCEADVLSAMQWIERQRSGRGYPVDDRERNQHP